MWHLARELQKDRRLNSMKETTEWKTTAFKKKKKKKEQKECSDELSKNHESSINIETH